MATIHPTAIVDRRAELADDVQIEAYAIIGPGVSLGAGTVVYSHSIIQGTTVIGANCRIGPAAHVGLDPQHLGFLNQPERPTTWLEIGDHTIIREGVSVHRSSKAGRENATRLGSHCLLMGASHIGHDSRVADHVILANAALVGGHCEIAERVFLGGGCAIHQFCRVGRVAIVGGAQACSRDVPPFAAMWYGGLKGYNAVGCRRAGMSRESIYAVRSTFHCLHTHRTATDAVAAIHALGRVTPEVREILDFIATSKRGVLPSVRFSGRRDSSDGAGE
ncbi:MAG: acyl-(acyl-carrier-protein)--UDP-N-acetylglucosa mineO-acyltransferase [Phycisphaerales bacterium]|nr:acyl-(acyl-carrier-protein)--UDP-N-acetylglucosa mineO-acyltransferase [Phycisphaerales bacterium]